jgi:hypothetical protein
VADDKTHPDYDVRLRAVIRELADAAVTAGRTDWDGYFGRDNTHHLSDLEKWPIYQELVKLAGGRIE